MTVREACRMVETPIVGRARRTGRGGSVVADGPLRTDGGHDREDGNPRHEAAPVMRNGGCCGATLENGSRDVHTPGTIGGQPVKTDPPPMVA